jgi:transcriptional regulator with XRE-family HTH domain
MSISVEQRGYLNTVLQRTGWSQSELALRAGLDPSTLSRFLSGDREGHSLRPATIRKIEKVSGISFSTNKNEPDTVAQGFAEAEAEPLTVIPASPMNAIVAALANGHRNVDPWTLRSNALESAGFRPGDIVIVALGDTPLSGDVVCAQHYDWSTGKAETLFRIFQPPYLVAASPDPAFMRPLVVDDAKVQIKGVVINTIRSRRAIFDIT